MKLYLITFDIRSLVSNGFAMVSAPNVPTAHITLTKQGRFCHQGYNIVQTLEMGLSPCPLIRVVSEGIVTLGAKGEPLRFEDLTPELKKELTGPKGDKGDKGDQGDKGDPGKDGSGGGGITFELGETLKLLDNILDVNTTDDAITDNTLPITSGGVDRIVGNIQSLLEII